MGRGTKECNVTAPGGKAEKEQLCCGQALKVFLSKGKENTLGRECLGSLY